MTGNITGYTIYPYIDVAIPGEQVPVEAQIQINQSNGINGAIINSDADGNFELVVPRGSDYQMSVTPLSPQNVPYLVLENMRFESDPAPMELDLGEGFPIYGRITDYARMDALRQHNSLMPTLESKVPNCNRRQWLFPTQSTISPF